MYKRCARGIWRCEPLEWRRVETRSLIGFDLAESLTTLPVGSCVGNLFGRGGGKVPPHQALLRKGKPTNQQHSTSVSTLKLDTGATSPEIPQTRRVDRLTVNVRITFEKQHCMFERVV